MPVQKKRVATNSGKTCGDTTPVEILEDGEDGDCFLCVSTCIVSASARERVMGVLTAGAERCSLMYNVATNTQSIEAQRG